MKTQGGRYSKLNTVFIKNELKKDALVQITKSEHKIISKFFDFIKQKLKKLNKEQQKLMIKVMPCSACDLKMSQIEEIYEKRLNSLADTFLTLVNNIENDSLFRDLEKVQIIESRKDLEIKQFKQKVYSFRMEFLQSVLEGVINQNQQSTIKKLQIQNTSLRNQNSYLKNIIEYNQLSYRNLQSESFQQYQNFSESPFCKFGYEEQQNCQKNKNNFRQKKQIFNRKTRNDFINNINRSKFNLEFDTEEIDFSSESGKGFSTPESTSFVVNLRENGSEDLSHNCISSIDPVSEISSFPSSQKSLIKGKNEPKTQSKNQFFTVSLRQQLSNLNSDSIKFDNLPNLPYSESRRKIPVKRIIEDEQNEENIEPEQYQFKYIKF